MKKELEYEEFQLFSTDNQIHVVGYWKTSQRSVSCFKKNRLKLLDNFTIPFCKILVICMFKPDLATFLAIF